MKQRGVRRVVFCGALALALAALGCGGDDGGRASGTVIGGACWVGGPVQSGEVTIYKLDSTTGIRTGDSWHATTDEAGRFEINVGEFSRSFDLECSGGRFVEAASGLTVQRGPALLRGLAFDLALGEHRATTIISPWSHLVWTLGNNRAAVEPDRLTAFQHARDLFEAHVGGWDPTNTAVAELGQPSTSATPEVLHALSLAGWSAMAQIAVDDGFADVTSETFAAVIGQDAASPERLLDGSDGTTDQLAVTAACPPPPGCAERGPRCFNACAVHASSIRGTLANGVRAYVRTHPATGQTASTLASWLIDLRDNDEPLLFPSAPPPEPFDTRGPTIVIESPALDGAPVSGSASVAARATDPIGVVSLVLETIGPGARPIVDSDPASDRATGVLDSVTPPLPEGAVSIRATATDTDGNLWHVDRVISVDNLASGAASGTVVKGRVSGATVQVYGYADGTRGALLGSGTTLGDGTFQNIAIAAGYSGPLLIEAGGGGAYPEEAAPAGTPNATFDLSDRLRSVVIGYADGGAVSNVVVSPLTELAYTYARFLRTVTPTGDFTAQWTAAVSVVAAQFGVTDILSDTPTSPSQITGVGNADRYALVLIGLSQTAYRASTQGGGDAGSFATAMDSIRVVNVLDQDLADGCFDGKINATTQLSYGGTQRPGDQAVRLDLANAIATYLGDGVRNATPLTVADVLPLLDTLALGGPTNGTGACPGGGLFETPGDTYDRTPPVIVWQAPTPVDGTWVRGTIVVQATATDEVDRAPTVTWLGGLVDSDGDLTNSVATAMVATGADGPLTIAARAVDDSGNLGELPVRVVNVDNTAPVVTVSPTGFYVAVAGDYWTASAAPTLTGSVTELNLVSVKVYAGAVELATATVAGSSWSLTLPVGTVAGTTPVTLRIEARDRAGNVASVTRSLRHDATPPTIATPTTVVRNEASDTISYNTTPVVFPSTFTPYDPTHTHAGPAVMLGASTSCDASSPTVTKYAYLLDESRAAYVTEAGGPAAQGRNPLQWQMTLTDDGVGIDPATTSYRVRDVAAGTTALDWLSLPGVGPYTVPLYRRGLTWPSIPALGLADSLYAIDFRGRDLLGREVTATRCWNHRSLAAPILVGPLSGATMVQCGANSTSCAATHGPGGSGKYALSLLSLGDTTSPFDPIGLQVLSDNVSGTGLMEYPAWNPTTEPIYLTVDLTNPAATYSKQWVDRRWAHTDGGAVACGTDDEGIDTSNPLCVRLNPPTDTVTTVQTVTAAAATVQWGVRVWEQVSTASYVELTACAGCSVTAPAGTTRLTVELPARRGPSIAGDPFPPRKFWIVPVAKSITDLRPAGVSPYVELTVAGVTVTGQVIDSRAGCATSISHNTLTRTYSCMRTVNYVRYRALVSAGLTIPVTLNTVPQTSRDGVMPSVPIHFAPALLSRRHPFGIWSTSEQPLPATP